MNHDNQRYNDNLVLFFSLFRFKSARAVTTRAVDTVGNRTVLTDLTQNDCFKFLSSEFDSHGGC